MDKWLDSLSEDWVSQPRSQHSSSVLQDSPSPSVNESQSRIPRYKHRSGSSVSIAGEPDRSSSRQSSKSHQAILKERTPSKINVSHRRLPNGQVKLKPSSSISKDTPRHQDTPNPTSPSQPGTVQHKTSPAKEENQHGTPEWKRRMLKGKIGPAEQKDLFSPIDLEGIFKPPTIGSKARSQAPAKSRSTPKEQFPSSPPLHPGQTRKTSLTSKGDHAEKSYFSSPRSRSKLKERGSQSRRSQLGDSKQSRPETRQGSHPRSIHASIAPERAPKNLPVEIPSHTTTPVPLSEQEKDLGFPQEELPLQSGSREDSKSLSGFDPSGNENISPFFVSKHNTVDGRVDYAAIDISMRRLYSNMDKLRIHRQNTPDSRSSDYEVDYADPRHNDQSSIHERLNEITSQSLPDDLSMGTDAFVANGGYVNIHRGGHSNDGSFQRRILSPGSSLDLDGPSVKACKVQSSGNEAELPTSSSSLPRKSEKSQSSPKTPEQYDADMVNSPERTKSSGSPLKLFDNYDTFTNEKLARRMSKFEETFWKASDNHDNFDSLAAPSSPSPGPKIPQKQVYSKQRNTEQERRGISSFGEGGLDRHSFDQYLRSDRSLSQHPFPVREPPVSDYLARRRSSSKRSNTEPPVQTSSSHKSRTSWDQDDENEQTRDDDGAVAENDALEVYQSTSGKRPPYSPVKDPAPKRRRTRHSSEERREAASQMERNHVEVPEPTAKSLLGRKRKDALYDGETQAADPKVLATRQILRPRAPTSIQNTLSRKQPTASPFSNAESMDVRNDAKTQRQERERSGRIDPPTEIVAGALATVALNAAQDITCGDRKASVTTADFFSEAQQIMKLIRAEKLPRSSRAIADTSQVEHQTIVEEPDIEDSTIDNFSRPPSREGGSFRKARPESRHDARVISHLRRYKDKDDLGLSLSSSLKSLRINRSKPASETSSVASEVFGEGESDPPNIRILERKTGEEQQESEDSLPRNPDDTTGTGNHAVDSQTSSDQSTKRSIPTGSSQSTRNKRIIAPETVAHLISDQVAGMVFDRQRQLWVRRKESSETHETSSHVQARGEDTEEDLFGDIPDLTVDEMEELKRVKEAVGSMQSFRSSENNTSRRDHAFDTASAPKTGEGPHDDTPDDGTRPKTADSKSTFPVENSSAPSKFSRFTSSGPLPGTRATSWGDEEWPENEDQAQPSRPGAVANVQQDHADDVEHEISILDGRVSEGPGRKYRQARVVTVAFSSPLVDQIPSPCSQNNAWDEVSELRFEESPSRQISQQTSSGKRQGISGNGRKFSQRSSSRRMLCGNQSYVARPMSRLDEQDELSIVHYSTTNGNRSMEVAISTPMPMNRSMLVSTTRSERSIIDFHLSPLPDFTIHQVDRPVDAALGTAANRQDPKALQEVGNRLSITGQELVKHLTDFEPYEPYWDYIRSVDLRGRGLTSLHMLDEFCSRTEDLDVSNNQIEDLNGVPRTVRMLNIQGNRLSDLAAWHHLQHLQYLDASGNRLQSLQSFQGLVHLRGLKVDDNDINDLSGIEDMNGLLSLKIAGNRLKAVDFDHFDLARLTELDLHQNSLVLVSNLHRLPALQTCNLSGNGLETFSPRAPLPVLEALDISNNCIVSTDLSIATNLRKLKVDKNAIPRLEGITNLKILGTLSWREQATDSEIQYQDCHEVHSLYISGNPLATFSPQISFLNLRHLELASAGLQTLAEDFGIKCPNLRIVNLNYNALRDTQPLLGIEKLQKLYLAGNRLSRLRRTVAVLDRLGLELSEVDMRNNPLTVGFYTPQDPGRAEKRMVIQDRTRVPYGDDEDAESKDAKAYLLPRLDKEIDGQSRERLDEDTKVRRRVYEMLIMNACKRLNHLDGLETNRRTVGRKDRAWERLLELGILRPKESETFLAGGECVAAQA